MFVTSTAVCRMASAVNVLVVITPVAIGTSEVERVDYSAKSGRADHYPPESYHQLAFQ
jgi:hypothetical protein